MTTTISSTMSLEGVLASPRLPTLPAVAIEILNLIGRSDTDFDDLAAVLNKDPALCARLFKSVNAASHGGHRVDNVHEAVRLVGLRGVKTLALGFSLVGELRGAKAGGFDYASFWRNSIMSAALARRVAIRTIPTKNESAYLGGLLRALGILVLHQVSGSQYEALAKNAVGYTQLRSLEQRHLGFAHDRVGGMLADRWSLPAPVAACVRWQHHPPGAPKDDQPVVLCVAAAAAICDLIAGDLSGAGRYLGYCHALGLDPKIAREIVEHAAPEIEELAEVVAFSELEPTELGALIETAHQALAKLSAESIEEERRMVAERDQLSVLATTDSLTGLHNRRSFDEALAAQLSIAQRYATPLSLVLFDVDNFKQINDRWGHGIGDEALKAVATVLRECCRDSDLPGRLGGDEFGLILPWTGAAGADLFAERLRMRIARRQIEESENGPVTVSLGVATYELTTHPNVAALSADADRHLYHAKTAGRNRVCSGRVDLQPVKDGRMT